MKRLNNFKIGVFFALLFLSLSSIEANMEKNQYILSGDEGLIDSRVLTKIYEIGKEVQTKSGIKIYLYVKNSYENISNNLTMKEKLEKIKEYENKIVNKLEAPYVLLTISLQQTHINFFTSEDLKPIFNKNEILNDYVVPLLASKDKNTLYSKVSAAVLNGYAQIGDEIAKNKNFKLESSIGSGGKTFATIWKVFIYFIIVTSIVAYAVTVFKARRKNK